MRLKDIQAKLAEFGPRAEAHADNLDAIVEFLEEAVSQIEEIAWEAE